MAEWEDSLKRWHAAGLLDEETAQRIQAWESGRDRGWRLPVLIALGLGALLLGAGVLLFVSAHWDELSPGGRLFLILILPGVFHVGGAFASFPALASALHAVGTVALGAGVFLAGQIFHLELQWTAGVLLWAVGAWLAYALLRDEPQLVISAILTPAWLLAEWAEHAGKQHGAGEGLFLLALAYFTSSRASLVWTGGFALLPTGLFLVGTNGQFRTLGLAWFLALLLPLGAALWLRRRTAWWNALATLWVAALYPLEGTAIHAWCAAAAVGLVAWGVLEARTELVNTGVAAFALTILVFYFSNVMDKLGRSLSLVALGVLFLAGGWGLEQLRRRLIASVRGTRA